MKKFLLTWLAIIGLTLSAQAQIIGDGIWGGGKHALVMSYTPVTWGTYNVAYTGATPSTVGGTSPYTYTSTGSALPTGTSINSSTGVISGTDSTDSADHTYTGIVVTVTDSASHVVNSSSFTINVAATLAMSYTPVTAATYNVAYTGATPSTAGGTTAYVYSSTGAALPPGITLNTSTGVLSGTDSTDSAGATYAGIIVTITDSHGRVVNSSSFTITVATPPSYAGPGDIVSGALMWASCARAYNAAYATGSNNACLLVDSATGLTTYTMKILSTGFADVAGAAASSACATACKVKTMYDQTGNGHNCTNSTLSVMPVFTFSAVNGLPGPAWTNVTSWTLICANNITQSAPYSYSVVYKRTAVTSGAVLDASGTGAGLCGTTSANQVHLTQGGTLTAAATDNSFHAVQTVLNGASSVVTVDASDTTGTVVGNYSAETIHLGAGGGGCAAAAMTGIIMEGGMWPAGFTSGNRTSLNSNQHSSTSGYNF